MAEAIRKIGTVQKLKKISKNKYNEKSVTNTEDEDVLIEICDSYEGTELLKTDSYENITATNSSANKESENDPSSKIVTQKTFENESNMNEQPIEVIPNAFSPNLETIDYKALSKSLHILSPFLKAEIELKNVVGMENCEEAPTFLKNHPASLSVNSEKVIALPTRPKVLGSVMQRCIEVEEVDVQSKSWHQMVLEESMQIKAFSELQLSVLYNNLQLEEKDKVISEFLNDEKNTDQCEFHEMLLSYMKSRISLLGTEAEIKEMRNDYKKSIETVWTFEEKTMTEEGTCEDDQLVFVTCNYEVASYHQDITDFIFKKLKHIRKTVFESSVLYIHIMEISKLLVDNYLQKVMRSHPYFLSLMKNALATCDTSQQDKALRKSIRKLKDCINVLFLFCRKNIKDVVFMRDIKHWLSDLIAILLRVASFWDHLFIVSHLLRCPAGVSEWSSRYIQVLPPVVNPGQEIFGSIQLDHLVTVLAILLEPVKERENFLCNYKIKRQPEDSVDQDSSRDSVWVLVDSSGEDEEDPVDVWHCFNENDMIQFLNQIPFKAMFKHILLIEGDEEESLYSIEKASTRSFMKLFAFCNCLVKLFQEGLKTYSRPRYKGIVKKISQLIRHTVHYVTEHWLNYVRKQEMNKGNITAEDIAMGARLQIEYDEFFENAVKAVFLSPGRAAWQFLAVIPYNCISLPRLWKVAYKLHIGYNEELVTTFDDWHSLLTIKDTRGQFRDQLYKMDDCDAYYLLTCLANLVICRPDEEKDFINAIVSNIFDVAFVNEETKEHCNRTGRDLLLAITAAHPFTLTTILTQLQENLSSIGSLSLFLLRWLSLQKWHPTEDDLQCLSYWLLFTPPSSLENQLARIVIGKLNWGFREDGKGLTLPKEIHERVALLLVEVALKISGKIGQGNLISEGVKQMTSVVYAQSPEQILLKWCWEVLNQLHIHKLDQTSLEVQKVLLDPSSVLISVGDPTTSPSLEFLKKGLKAKHPLSLCVAMLMTSWGHSIPEICSHCPECLEVLVGAGFYEAALTVLHLITPFFFGQHEELISDPKFMGVVQSLLAADLTYVSLAKSYISTDGIGNILKFFEDLIIDQLTNYERYGFESPAVIVSFWLHILTTFPSWRGNINVLKVIDVICQFSLFDAKSWHILKDLLREQKKVICGEPARGIGSILTWVSSPSASHPPSSLVPKAFGVEAPWFALAALMIEAQNEISCGLWKGILTELHNDPTASLESVVKNVCNYLEIDVIPSSYLTIYKLGQQIIDLPISHSALPLTLQIYLILHLSRVPPIQGQYDCSSVIFKFFEGYFNTTFIRRIKQKVADLVTHSEKELAAAKTHEGDEFSDQLTVEYLTELTVILKGMALWLDETRLYETGLYIPALSPLLLPNKLPLIFQESWELWPELIDFQHLKNSLSNHVVSWRKHRSHNAAPSTIPVAIQSDSEEPKKANLSPAESIMKRLEEYDTPQPPPPVPLLQLRKIKDTLGCSLEKNSILFDVERYTELIVDYAHTMMLRSNEMCALDCVYIELLPQLWSNPSTKTVMPTNCKPKRSSKHKECSGAANIIVEFCEKRLNEGIKARLDQNREQWGSLLRLSMAAPPLQVCEATIHLEELLGDVVQWHKKLMFEGALEEARYIVNFGRELFHLIIQLTSDETTLYPPAKQLIASGAETLGQEFLSSHMDCQESLVAQVLHSSSQIGSLLSPHFTPAITPVEMYLSLYSCLSPHVPTQSDLCFMLLSKFDIESWLHKRQISYHDRTLLIKTIGEALTSLLSCGQQSTVICLELYRVHLMALLDYSFSEHFAQVLLILLEISGTIVEDCGDVGRSIWYDLLNALGKGFADDFSTDLDSSLALATIRIISQNQRKLSPQMTGGILRQLSTHFIHHRLQFGLIGLYPKFRLFVKPISILLAVVSHCFIVTADSVNLGIKEIWEAVEGLWAAWVAPLGGKQRESLPNWIRELTRDKTVLLPWSSEETKGPSIAMAMYSGTVAFLNEKFQGSGVLSMYLEYYFGTYASPDVKDHVLRIVHYRMSSLHWHLLCPSLKDVEILSKIVNEYLPECHSFIGNIFIQIPWNKVVKSFSIQNPEQNNMPLPAASCVRIHILLLNILVRISMEPSVRQVWNHLNTSLYQNFESGLLHPLLLMAESFEWKLVDAKNYESVINWFVMSCDPRIVLNMQNRNPIDVNIIRLLHVSAGYTRESHLSTHRSGQLKRHLLVRALCRLIITAATRHKALLSARKALFAETYAILLTQMEDTVVEGLEDRDQFTEGSLLSSEVVTLIGGGTSPPVLQEVCRDSLVIWLQKAHSSTAFLFPLAASISKGVLMLHHRSPLMESSLRSLFSHPEETRERDIISWSCLMAVLSFPLTSPMSFLSFAAQENHLLVVFALIKWWLSRAHDSDKALILTSLIGILPQINPDESCESGLILVIFEVLQLIQSELQDSVEGVWTHCQKLSSHLFLWGEDRSSQGILAAIGLGKKSVLSVRMRLVCKSLHAFLIGQLLSPGIFRAINEQSKSILEIDQGADECYEESQKAVRQFIALKLNASYCEYKPVIDFAVSFLQESGHTIRDTKAFLKEMVLMLYPEEAALQSFGEDCKPNSSSGDTPKLLAIPPKSSSSSVCFEAIAECSGETVSTSAPDSDRPTEGDSYLERVTPSAPPPPDKY